MMAVVVQLHVEAETAVVCDPGDERTLSRQVDVEHGGGILPGHLAAVK